MLRFFIGLAALCSTLQACKKPETGPPLYAKPALVGADLSMLPELRKSSGLWYNSKGQPEDMLQTLLRAGINMVRLRLWYKPEAGARLSEAQQLCAELRRLGLKTFISVHYSDTWADPAHQSKPEAWNNINVRTLADSVYAYTKQVMLALQPDYIQIGNEINSGLLWPEGNSRDTAGMLGLIRAGIKAVRQVEPKTQVVIHMAMLEDVAATLEPFRNVDYDVLGLSYYPMWHGKDLNLLKQRMELLHQAFKKPILLAETSYPFTLGWNDQTHNVVGLDDQLLPQFPSSPEGQKAFLWAIRNLMLSVEGGLGFCYWGAEWTAWKGNAALDGSSWENQALWDFQGRALPAMDVFW
jgi:arabinogalactan endo-1,4-beta-galactosidase